MKGWPDEYEFSYRNSIVGTVSDLRKIDFLGDTDTIFDAEFFP